MGIGNKLLDPTYKPESLSMGDSYSPNQFSTYGKIIKCPVRFTNDIIEYCESKEFIGMTLKPLQKKFIEEIFSVDSNNFPNYNEGVLCAGMRSGKSWTAAFIATGMTQMLLQEDNPAQKFGLAVGTRITCQSLASSEIQSKETAFAAIKSIVTYSTYWKKYKQWLIDRENNGEGKESLFQSLNQTIEFKEKNIAIMSLNSSSSSLAGKSSYLVILDELSRLATIEGSVQGKTENRTAEAVYSTVSRSIMSLKGFGKVITVSSPLYEDDYTMKLVKMAGKCDVGSQAYIINSLRDKEPKKISTIYAMHATTYEFNPDITEDDLASERDKNFFTYTRDYLGVPSSAINPFIEHGDRILSCINSNKDPLAVFEDKIIEETVKSGYGVETRSYIGKTIYPAIHDKVTKYFICCDQGQKKDSFVISVGHSAKVILELPLADGKINKVEKYKVIIDLVEEWKPDPRNKITVSFRNVEEVLETLNNYIRIDSILFDRWNSVESIERLFSKGIHTEQVGATIEMYDTLKMLIYANMIEFPDNSKLVTELRQLNRIRTPSGKMEKVEHPPEGGKDNADAVVRVAWMVYNDSIKSATRGEFIMPIVQRFSTVRGAAQYFEEQKNNGSSDAIWGSGSSQGSPFGGNNDSLFGGSDTYIRGNVQGDFRKNK